MGPTSTPLIRHVSRRELAQNRYVWLATGGMYAFFALITLALLMTTGGFAPRRLQLMVVALLAVAIVHLRIEPPALGSARNHAVIACVSLVSALTFWSLAPNGAIALGAMAFVGPLAAVRLQDRRQIATHIVASSVLVISVAFAAENPEITRVAVLMMSVAGAVLCYSCTAILEAAEAQGDELETLVRRDPLTGIGNRRLLDERLADELLRHERTQRPLSLVTLDLNGFKALNDSRGHAAGDELLRDVATALTRATDPRDTLVRQGGDEFFVLLPDSNRSQAERSCNAIRAELAPIGVATGFGIATYPEDAIEGHVLLHLADERLRDDKRRRGLTSSGEPGAIAAPSTVQTPPDTGPSSAGRIAS